jgi:hypothetical protein
MHRTIMGACGAAIGLSCAIAADVWPANASYLQMGMYTCMVFIPVIVGTWPKRRGVRYVAVLTGIAILHGYVLFLLRREFPIRTILALIPTVFVEIIGASVLIIKIVAECEDKCRRG